MKPYLYKKTHYKLFIPIFLRSAHLDPPSWLHEMGLTLVQETSSGNVPFALGKIFLQNPVLFFSLQVIWNLPYQNFCHPCPPWPSRPKAALMVVFAWPSTEMPDCIKILFLVSSEVS